MGDILIALQYSAVRHVACPNANDVRDWKTQESYYLRVDEDERRWIHKLLRSMEGFLLKDPYSGISQAWWRLVVLVEKSAIRTSDGGEIVVPGFDSGLQPIVLLGPWKQGEGTEEFAKLVTYNENLGRYELRFGLPEEWVRDKSLATSDNNGVLLSPTGELYKPGEEVEEEKTTLSIRSTVRDANGEIVETGEFETAMELAAGDEVVVEGPDGRTFTFEVLG